MVSSGKIEKNREIEGFKELPNGQQRFAKGNKIGRMKKKGYTIADLTKVAMQYDKTHDETILKHYIEELMKDNTLLKDFVNKYVPTRNINELTGAGGGPVEIFEIIKTYEQPKQNEQPKSNQHTIDPKAD